MTESDFKDWLSGWLPNIGDTSAPDRGPDRLEASLCTIDGTDPGAANRLMAELLEGPWLGRPLGELRESWREPMRTFTPEPGTGFRRYSAPPGATFPLWRRIDPARFSMGSDPDPLARQAPVPAVTEISCPYFVLATPLTTGQCRLALPGHSSGRNERDSLAAGGLSHSQAKLVCRALHTVFSGGLRDLLPSDADLEGIDNFEDEYQIRLPTEAEWELACRQREGVAPQDHRSRFWFGDDEQALELGSVFLEVSGRRWHVGQVRPNAAGLFDLHGNVLEWCEDWYEERLVSGRVDPWGPETGHHRVQRGGSYFHEALRSSAHWRSGQYPSNRVDYFGLRPVIGPRRSTLGSGSA